MPRIPSLLGDLGRAWARDPGVASGTTSLWSILAALAGAALAALLAHLVLGRLGTRKLASLHEDFAGRLKVSGLQLLIDLLALACFVIAASLAIWQLVPAAGLPGALANGGLAVIGVFGCYFAAGRFLLAPGHPERRLMPLPNADWHMGAIAAYGLAGPILVQSLPVLRGADADPSGATGWFFLSTTLISLYKVAWFWLGRRDIAAMIGGLTRPGRPEPGLIRRIGAHAIPWLYIGVAIAIWLVSVAAIGSPVALRLAAPAGLTQILTVLLPILAIGASALGRALSRRIHGEEGDPGKLAAAAALCTLFAGAVWVASLAILVRLWSEYLVDPVSEEAVSALRIVTRTGAAIVVGWTIWTLAKTYFDAAAPTPHGLLPGEEDAEEAHAASRLATALPLVRNLVLGAVLAVTALVILSALGLEIGPFLAGFGVIGLAISFGSQALVRDIVSGIFFMADDAFRVGEYIDTGRLKGTVEKITLRSVQLRHQNGQIHNIPFGQIQSTTNFSRDWTTVKFVLRLDREADLEKARRAIKKVGEAMMEDPELSAEMLQPLKMQGIQDIADGAIVIRCKFTCRPLKPSFVQREALKRLHRALPEAGVAFASSAVVVKDAPAAPAAVAAAAAAAAAAPATEAAS